MICIVTNCNKRSNGTKKKVFAEPSLEEMSLYIPYKHCFSKERLFRSKVQIIRSQIRLSNAMNVTVLLVKKGIVSLTNNNGNENW